MPSISNINLLIGASKLECAPCEEETFTLSVLLLIWSFPFYNHRGNSCFHHTFWKIYKIKIFFFFTNFSKGGKAFNHLNHTIFQQISALRDLDILASLSIKYIWLYKGDLAGTMVLIP